MGFFFPFRLKLLYRCKLSSLFPYNDPQNSHPFLIYNLRHYLSISKLIRKSARLLTSFLPSAISGITFVRVLMQYSGCLQCLSILLVAWKCNHHNAAQRGLVQCRCWGYPMPIQHRRYHRCHCQVVWIAGIPQRSGWGGHMSCNPFSMLDAGQ